ncbi:glycosyltransferase family 4 protein [Halalkalibacter alkalisediminis]|uniref:Glycosyltransferase family 4 protein n=1 Tax=Halalkalibacter alkalisediminis TaxID=935616 RepID=A0ABV6NJ22_9BACI|nr:glycosyltransferase family 4 protein [Halalkalibacter alkalisediminis]
MKILMICTEKLPVPAVRGGAIQTYIDGVSPTLAKHHDLTILGTTDPSLPHDEKVNNIRYVRTPGGLLEDYRDGVKQFLQSEPESYDVIHIFNRPRLVLAVRECAPNARIILSMHNDMFKRQKIEPQEAEAAIEQLDKIITVSHYIGKTISDLFPQAASKLKTIYSGVDIDRFVPPHSKKALEMRNAIRQEHNLEGKKVILFAGRLSANKGADILVQAMPILAKKHPDIALVLVGSKWFSVNEVSDYVAYVRALAARLPIPVVNTGFVAPSEIQRWFAAADVFVCPSQWQEPLARVHYEAMASGLPIITTARGGNPEVIIPDENGFVVEQPEEPQAFADLLAPLLSDPKLSKRLGINGRKLAEEKFTWERVITDISDTWNEVEFKIKNNIAVTSEEPIEGKNLETTVNELSPEEPLQLTEPLSADGEVLNDQSNDQDLPVEGLLEELVTEEHPEDATGDSIIELSSEEPVQESPNAVNALSEVGNEQTSQLDQFEVQTLEGTSISKELSEEVSPADLIKETETSMHSTNRKVVKLSDSINKENMIHFLLSNINTNKQMNKNDLISDFERLLKKQLDVETSQSTTEYIKSVNDLTTVKLFERLVNKRRQNRNRK